MVYIIGLSSVSVLALFCFWQYTMCHPLNGLENATEVIGWEQNRSRNASDYIFPDRITTLVNSNKTCSAAYPPRVLIIITSSTDHFTSRTVIRKTWAHSIGEKFNISVAFLVGVSGNESVNDRIRNESKEFGDIIVEDFVDTYNNLTLKSLMMLKWVKNNCPNVPYVIKLDDDVYMNVKNLAGFVDDIPLIDSPNLFCGDLRCLSKPVRDLPNKWYIPPYMYAEQFYPDYLAGQCYFIETKIALQIYDEAFRIPMIHLEDVFVTGICAQRRGIRPLEHHLFRGIRQGEDSMKSCYESKYYIVHSSHISAERMDAVHTFITNCYNNETARPPAEYNGGTILARCPVVKIDDGILHDSSSKRHSKRTITESSTTGYKASAASEVTVVVIARALTDTIVVRYFTLGILIAFLGFFFCR